MFNRLTKVCKYLNGSLDIDERQISNATILASNANTPNNFSEWISRCIERKEIPFSTICSGVKSGLLEYNYQGDPTIRYKRTK
jgi:hypothetical protein